MVKEKIIKTKSRKMKEQNEKALSEKVLWGNKYVQEDDGILSVVDVRFSIQNFTKELKEELERARHSIYSSITDVQAKQLMEFIDNLSLKHFGNKLISCDKCFRTKENCVCEK